MKFTAVIIAALSSTVLGASMPMASGAAMAGGDAAMAGGDAAMAGGDAAGMGGMGGMGAPGLAAVSFTTTSPRDVMVS